MGSKRAGPPSLIWGSPRTGGDLEARDLDAKNGWSGQGVASSVRAEATEAVADVTPTLRHTVSFIC